MAAYVMAIRMIMTMRMAPNLPSTATAAAGGTNPANTPIYQYISNNHRFVS